MKYNYKSILLIVLLVITIIIYNNYTKNINGFQNNYNYNKWPSDLIRRFNIYQTTMNNNVNQFDLELLQKQASVEEVEELMKTGFWPWPDDLKFEYIKKIWASPIIKINPQFALNYAMGVYNQNAARELLAWNSKEGQFLLYGGNIGKSEELVEQGIKDVNNSIKCSTDTNGNSIMEKTVYTGVNLWNGYMNSTVTKLKSEDIPKEMPGFNFVKGPCNPCVALDSPGNFSCPFRLNVEGDDSISVPWKQLWNV